MGTRSNIGIQNEDGTIDFIYCHWGGYPSNNGQLLREHYDTAEKVRELVALGDISSLKERATPVGPHSYDAPEKGVTIAYGRDRGEEDVATSTAGVGSGIHHEEYAYLYAIGGVWTGCGRDGKWMPLDMLIATHAA